LLEIESEALSCLVTSVGRFLEQLGDDQGETVRQGSIEGVYERWSLRDMGMDNFEWIGRMRERSLTGEDFEESSSD